jgi:hypothetical protein
MNLKGTVDDSEIEIVLVTCDIWSQKRNTSFSAAHAKGISPSLGVSSSYRNFISLPRGYSLGGCAARAGAPPGHLFLKDVAMESRQT